MKLKLCRDKVISIVNGKDLVGVYVKYPHKVGRVKVKELLLAEVSPEKADKIISLWNAK